MPPDPSGQGLERLLDAAEVLFLEQGYATVKLRHIADRIAVKESSIYYHFPQGKEALYVAVMQRSIARHHAGLRRAISAETDWRRQLHAAAQWLAGQPAVDVMRLSKSDLPSIAPAAAHQLEESMYAAVNEPIRQILEHAVAQGQAQVSDADLIAGVFVAMVASVDVIKGAWNPRSKRDMVELLVDSWVQGLGR